MTSNESDIMVDPIGRHSALLSRRPQGRPEVSKEDSAQIAAYREGLKLNDESRAEFRPRVRFLVVRRRDDDLAQHDGAAPDQHPEHAPSSCRAARTS